ncbi:MAG TPA: hypothetical protein VM686_08330 [Polyangiaceae bacterium]|nr:hypothetical protein [Polyangiaceae bacterium]
MAVGAFSGPKSKQVRGWVLKGLKAAGEYEITDAEDVKGGGKAKGYAEAAKGLGVDAIVVGKVSKKSNLTLTIYNAADGSSLGDVEIQGGDAKKLQKSIDNELAIAIADPLAQAKAAKAGEAPKEEASEDSGGEEPSGESEEPAEEEAEEEAPSGGGDDDEAKGPSPLELMAGLRAFNRTFEYKDAPNQVRELNTYELPLGPALLVDILFYPGAFFSDGIGANIGIGAHFEQGFGTRSIYGENTATPIELETSMQEIRIGPRFRIPFGTHAVEAFAEYGIHKFRLAGDEDGTANPAFPLVPDTDYRLIRPGIDARFRFSEYMIGLHAAPRILLSMGELEKPALWFPGATGMGFDAGLILGYAIIPSLDVVAGVDYVRYGFDFNAIPLDNPVIAGGATDTYISGFLGLAFRLAGK